MKSTCPYSSMCRWKPERAGRCAEASHSTNSASIVFVEISPLDVSDELIAEIKGLAEGDSQDAGKASTLGQVASDAHATAVAAEKERKAAEEEAARKAAELQAALDANPRVVQAGVSKSSAPLNLTGTIEIRQGEDQVTHEVKDVVLLVLPNEVELVGTQYTSMVNKNIALHLQDNEIAQYRSLADKNVTMNLALGARGTTVPPYARFTYLLGYDSSVVKVFD